MSLLRTPQTNVTRRNFYSNEPNAHTPIPQQSDVFFKDIWTTETLTQVCQARGEFFGNIEVKAADGTVYVFFHEGKVTRDSESIAEGLHVSTGEGWVRVQGNNIGDVLYKLNTILLAKLKDIWTTETFTQVCVSDEFFGNIEVKTADGKVHVFAGEEGVRPESVEIADGFELDEGDGWVRVQKNTIDDVCDELNAILVRNGLYVRR